MVEVVLTQQGRGEGRSSPQVKSGFVWFRGISVDLGNRCCDHRCARPLPGSTVAARPGASYTLAVQLDGSSFWVVVAQVMPSTWSCSSSRKIEHSLGSCHRLSGDRLVGLFGHAGGPSHVGIGADGACILNCRISFWVHVAGVVFSCFPRTMEEVRKDGGCFKTTNSLLHPSTQS